MRPIVNVGDFRNRITIQSVSVTQDVFGGVPDPTNSDNWATVASTWANVMPEHGREFGEAGKQQAEETVRIDIRYRTGIDATMRVLSGDKVYDIRSLTDQNSRRKLLTMMCRERL